MSDGNLKARTNEKGDRYKKFLRGKKAMNDFL